MCDISASSFLSGGMCLYQVFSERGCLWVYVRVCVLLCVFVHAHACVCVSVCVSISWSHLSFCLLNTLALCNTPLITNSFPEEPLHSNYQTKVRPVAPPLITLQSSCHPGDTTPSTHLWMYEQRSPFWIRKHYSAIT